MDLGPFGSLSFKKPQLFSVFIRCLSSVDYFGSPCIQFNQDNSLFGRYRQFSDGSWFNSETTHRFLENVILYPNSHLTVLLGVQRSTLDLDYCTFSWQKNKLEIQWSTSVSQYDHEFAYLLVQTLNSSQSSFCSWWSFRLCFVWGIIQGLLLNCFCIVVTVNMVFLQKWIVLNFLNGYKCTV